MTAQELRGKTTQELQAALRELLSSQFVLRMQRATDQQIKTHLFQSNRRDIARIKTVLQQKESQGETA